MLLPWALQPPLRFPEQSITILARGAEADVHRIEAVSLVAVFQ